MFSVIVKYVLFQLFILRWETLRSAESCVRRPLMLVEKTVKIIDK